jgi:DNA invertase Pin-like site-specific DNA recombinase
MRVVAWARVSSREQREGYSIDAQLRAMRDRAAKSGWTIVREFVTAESAKRGADRVAFNAMLKWVRGNAKRERLEAVFAHKLDRACRNMRDAVRLQELEDTCGIRLVFVENEFGPGAAGALSFNMMAAVAQYYSDNLRTEVIKGMDEKVRQGWPTGSGPYGYMNVSDRDEPVQPHPERSRTVVRLFELYATGRYTFKSLADQLAAEGHVYRPSQPRFTRTSISYILNNRFYIGELHRNGQAYEGRYRRLIDRVTFEGCQRVLHGRNRRVGQPDLPLSGGLLRCACCGQSMTGERIRRKLRSGGVREHVYYRCANNNRGEDHPMVRWKAADLEAAIVDDLAQLRMPSAEIADWFRDALAAAFDDLDSHKTCRVSSLRKRRSELANMQDRLLNAYLAGSVPEETYRAKQDELAAEVRSVQESLDETGEVDPRRGSAAIAVFDWSQNAAGIWRGSNNDDRRAILDALCLNRAVGPTSLALTKRKPFDVLAEGLSLGESRGDRI